MINKSEAADHLPDNGRILFTCKNGKIQSVRSVCEDEHVSSLKSLIELAEKAGYMIVKKSDPAV